MKVLQIFGEPLSFGGQEAFTMNMYECIDRNKIQFDFFTPFYCNNEEMKKKINLLGGNVYVGNKEFETKKRKINYFIELNKFLKLHKYDIVHINSGSTFSLAYGSMIAKKNNVKKVIVHSHSNGVKSFKHMIINLLSKTMYRKYTDIYLACSDEAAKWKFPKKIIENHEYIIIKNGIQVKKYTFDNKIRQEYRKELNYNENNIVLGHIGRMEKEKNHLFILDVFNELIKKNENMRLLLIGSGSLKEKIMYKIKELNLETKVTILEKRSDINCLLQAMDLFIFPSLYEGLGIVAIEAQASGLKVFASENILEDVKVTDNIEKIELSKGAEYWADEIFKQSKKENIRKECTSNIKDKGYDAEESANILEKIYCL